MKVRYLTDEQWSNTALQERALLLAAQECDLFKVREEGRNGGAKVLQYLQAAGVTVKAPWCASFVTWCLLQAGAKRESPLMPNSPASCCNWIGWADLRGKVVPKEKAGRGCLFAWCDRKSWTGHIGFVVKVYKVLGIWFVETVEGNTGDPGDPKQDGVFRKRRRVTSSMVFIRYWQ